MSTEHDTLARAHRVPLPGRAAPRPGDGLRTEADPAPCTTEWITEPGAFALLAPAWRRLTAACPSATPFQSHAWLSSWW
ncbi:glycosyl transferase family 1, partial [Streptomyces sp. SID8380]|nr:glycosyl transferase family 1 [Streptomyces sp. SID8380]